MKLSKLLKYRYQFFLLLFVNLDMGFKKKTEERETKANKGNFFYYITYVTRVSSKTYKL